MTKEQLKLLHERLVEIWEQSDYLYYDRKDLANTVIEEIEIILSGKTTLKVECL